MKKPGTVSNAVLASLSQGPLTVGEIADQADTTRPIASATLTRLHLQKRVARVEAGKWKLTGSAKREVVDTAQAQADLAQAHARLLNGHAQAAATAARGRAHGHANGHAENGDPVPASSLATKIRALAGAFKVDALTADELIDRILVLVENA